MCRLPMIRAPASGRFPACCVLSVISPGISCSARRISFRPNSASDRSFTLKGSRPAADAAAKTCGCSVTVAMLYLLLVDVSGRCEARRGKKPRPFRLGIGNERDNPDIGEAGVTHQLSHLVVSKAETEMP